MFRISKFGFRILSCSHLSPLTSHLNILLLNQCFYPDVVSTAQHLTDLAVELAGAGHSVTVVASRRGYDDPSILLPRRQTWKGISIVRIGSLALGKKSRWRRVVSSASFWIRCILTLLRLPRFDVVLALTSPPLISLLGAWFCRLKGGRLVVWMMDLNPDQAIAAGWLRPGSLLARLLERMLRFTLRQADSIIALDRFMKDRLAAKQIDPAKIHVIPPWTHDDSVRYDLRGRRAFRQQHGLQDKFVVMYSGNHSVCHPLDTLLEAAVRLSHDGRFAFCFVGGGAEFENVKEFARSRRLGNVVCLPYQPMELLSGSLSAADVHAVVLGDPFVGIVHPCKIYNVLRIGVPFIAIGPERSHVTDLFTDGEVADLGLSVRHGDAASIVEFLEDTAAASEWRGLARDVSAASRFTKAALLPLMLARMGLERLEVAGERLEAAGEKLEVAGERLEVAGGKLEAAGGKLEAAGSNKEQVAVPSPVPGERGRG